MSAPCPKCIEKWGQEPSAWGDSVGELDAYREHLETHALSAATSEESHD